MKRKPFDWFKARIVFLSILLFFCFVLIGGRLFQFQVLKKEQLYEMAARQQHVQVPLVPKRGTIYDCKGNELAVSLEVDSIYADGRKVVDAEKEAGDLASILQIDREELRLKLKSHKSFEWIERKISPEKAIEIKTLGLPGISFIKENQRFYPNAQLAAHLVGFVGLDSKGLEGVEFQCDGLLKGKGSVWTLERDALGRGIMTDGAVSRQEDQYRNVFLTLDKPIQHVVETELSRAVQKWKAKGGIAIAMDPPTGKVLAMASYPSYNPNQFMQYRSAYWRNRAIADAFEPGSIFKTFLAAAALDEKVVRPTDSFFCENGSYSVYDRTIHDHSSHGWLTFQQIIKFSSNIGASKVGEKIGKDRFYRYISAFGFGEKTGIGLSGEGKGILSHPRYWSPITLNTISFGQGISVTGIQLATAFSAIANGGLLMKPYVVEKVTNEKEEIVQSFRPEVVRRVISEETAKKVTALLKSTTEKGGTGEAAVPAGYDVAGKTGTAQKVDSLLRKYFDDRYTSGFVGFAPADEPRLVLLVVIDEPQGSSYGGVVAAPVFRAILEKVLPYLDAYPKGTLIVKRELDSTPEEATPTQEPVDAVKVGKSAGVVVMPDLTGLPMRSALSLMEGKGLIIRVSGNGKVAEQTPKPGTIVGKGEICYLKFVSPS